MSVFYVDYTMVDPSKIKALTEKGYIEFHGNSIGYMWTPKGLKVMDEFTQNLASLG